MSETKNRSLPKNPYAEIGREEFMKKLEPLLTPSELETVMTAYVFAKYGHKNQSRDDGVRYFEHPKAVAMIAIDELHIFEWQTIVMALLHDIVEDSFILSWNRIEKNFGREVTLGIKLLTKQPKDGYCERLTEFGEPDVILVKLCDRLHNMRTLGGCNRQKQLTQIEETRQKFLPMCDILINRLTQEHKWRGEYIKNQLMELCKVYD